MSHRAQARLLPPESILSSRGNAVTDHTDWRERSRCLFQMLKTSGHRVYLPRMFFRLDHFSHEYCHINKTFKSSLCFQALQTNEILKPQNLWDRRNLQSLRLGQRVTNFLSNILCSLFHGAQLMLRSGYTGRQCISQHPFICERPCD